MQVLPVLALTLVTLPYIAVGEALLVRSLDFRKLALRNIAGSFVGAVAGIATAFSEYAPWALVVQRAVSSVIVVACLAFQTRYLPLFAIDREKGPMLARSVFSIWVVIGVGSSVSRVCDALIGFLIGSAALGIAKVAGRFFDVLNGSLTNAFMAMWVPIMSKVSKDPARRADMFIDLSALAAMMTLPVFAGVGLVAEPLTQALLPPAYGLAAPIMEVYALGSMLIPIAAFRGSVLIAMRRNKLNLMLTCLDLVAITIVLVVAAPYGIIAALLGAVVSSCLIAAIGMFILFRTVGVRAARFAAAVAPAYIGVAAMSAMVWPLGEALAELSPLLRLAILSSVGAATYCGYIWFAHRTWALANIKFLRHPR